MKGGKNDQCFLTKQLKFVQVASVNLQENTIVKRS